MEENNIYLERPFEDLVATLLNGDVPFKPSNLYRLSDLAGEDLDQFKQAWPNIPEWRRQALLEEMEQLYEADYLLSFEAICRLALEDNSPQIRFIAIRSLQEYEVKDLIPVFLRSLDEEEDEEMRALAAISLGKYVYLGEIDELSPQTLMDIETCLLKAARLEGTPLIRRRAIEALGYSGHHDVPELIEAAFNTKDDTWKISALFAMGRSCDPRWEPQVLQMLDHVSPEIRFEAARAAGELEIRNAKPQLLALLEDDSRDVRMAALWSLSQIGGTGLEQVFEDMLEETEDDEDAQIIEDALDNLFFSQNIVLQNMLDFDDDTNLKGDIDKMGTNGDLDGYED